MKAEIEWRDVNEALPSYGVEVLLSVGWPDEGRYRVVVGERNVSSDAKDFGQDYWWIHGPHGGQRAEAGYIGLPSHWAFMPAHARAETAESESNRSS